MSGSESWPEHDVLTDPDATVDDYRLEIETLRESLERARNESLALSLADTLLGKLELVTPALILSSRTLCTLARTTTDAAAAEKLKELAYQMQTTWEQAAP